MLLGPALAGSDIPLVWVVLFAGQAAWRQTKPGADSALEHPPTPQPPRETGYSLLLRTVMKASQTKPPSQPFPQR